eukprot:m.171759 g.171759  ORF g.171759 m.171759 type:complete len:344 (-) comp16712_c0_seq1:1516-2547(-)
MDDSALILVATATAIVYEGSRRVGRQESNQNEPEPEETVEITTSHSVWFPLVASCALLTLYVFFDQLQLVFIVLNIILSSGCMYNFLHPLIPIAISATCNCRPSSLKRAVSIFIAAGLTFAIVGTWVTTNNPLFLDLLGIGLSIFMLTTLRLNDAKAAAYLGAALLIYDVFWVFVSPYVFEHSVMVEVARKSANNPLKHAATHLNWTFASALPKLDLPVKLIIPSLSEAGRGSILGLGDVVLPGTVVCYASRLDAAWTGKGSINYRLYTLLGYATGLVAAIFMARYFQLAQPALLYLVPAVLGSLMYRAVQFDTVKDVWEGLPLQYTRLDSGVAIGILGGEIV